jgi:O-antigen/teichoic acid export membrane protein
MWATLYGLIINVILNILFIPLYGIIAASVNTVITEYIIFFLEFYFLWKVLKKHKQRLNIVDSRFRGKGLKIGNI